MSSIALVFKTELERFRITCIFNIVKRVLQLQLQLQYPVQPKLLLQLLVESSW
jgi:hypothetical protein